MAPNPKVLAAFRAMKDLGISEEKVKPVLKKLLRVYDKNWELIEEENYRALADAVFEEDETKTSDQKKKPRTRAAILVACILFSHLTAPPVSANTLIDILIRQEKDLDEEAQGNEELERPLKRLRLQGREGQSSVSNHIPGSGGPSLIKPNVKEEKLPGSFPSQQSRHTIDSPQTAAESARGDSRPHEIQQYTRSRRKQPVSDRPLLALRSNEPTVESSIMLRPKLKVHNTLALIKPKDEPYTYDMPNFDVPLAVIHPDTVIKEGSLGGNIVSTGVHGLEPLASEFVDKRNRGDDDLTLPSEKKTNCEIATVAEEPPPNMEIGSSLMGEVKISLSCNPVASNFHMPNMDAVMKLMEEKCLRSYRIVDPNFSFKNLMNDMCNSILELGTQSNHESHERSENELHNTILESGTRSNHESRESSESELPAFDLGTKPTCQDVLHCSLLPARNCDNDNVPRSHKNHVNGCLESSDKNLQSFVVVQQCELSASDIRLLCDKNDITKGEEKVNISWVNDINTEFPPAFQYIAQTIIFRSASVNFTLKQIADKNCCSMCVDDCLASSAPCSCADETRSFLDECVTVSRYPQEHHFYCQLCPFEQSKKGDEIYPCKGHLKRKFIKECWIKCGCNKQQCSNRVVQRGINCKLQVFMTPDGKGWGLRTLEELPKGAFVCEFVGEILTLAELHERDEQNTKERLYTVLLDAGWEKGVPEDDKALCIDSTSWGNVARFINHRCSDANLVEIPVEVETPDHSYYHVALFTTRKVEAMEELTRDYGIDFDDHDQTVRKFQCLCGSKFCRNIKRSKRSRSAATAQ